MKRIFACAAALLAACQTTALHADVTYVSQSRSVTGYAGYPTQSTGSQSAPDFGPFSGNVNVSGANPGTFPPSAGVATQVSTLTGGGISIEGKVGGTNNYGINGWGTGKGQSIIDVTFTVDAPTDYEAGDTWITDQGPLSLFPMEHVVTLTNTSSLESFDLVGGRSGSLEPGQYRYLYKIIDGRESIATGTMEKRYYANLTFVPEPAGAAVIGIGAFVLTASRRRR